MLRPKSVEAYDGTLNCVVDDLIEKLKLRRQENSSDLITDISAEFYRFGLEGKSQTTAQRIIPFQKTTLPHSWEREFIWGRHLALRLCCMNTSTHWNPNWLPLNAHISQIVMFRFCTTGRWINDDRIQNFATLKTFLFDLQREKQSKWIKNNCDLCDMVSDINLYSFHCSFLQGISSVLFESRIGCLEPVIPMETERFIQSINSMFVMTLLTMAMPAWLHRLFPKPWDTFCRSWDYLFQFGEWNTTRPFATRCSVGIMHLKQCCKRMKQNKQR